MVRSPRAGTPQTPRLAPPGRKKIHTTALRSLEDHYPLYPRDAGERGSPVRGSGGKRRRSSKYRSGGGKKANADGRKIRSALFGLRVVVGVLTVQLGGTGTVGD